MYNTRLKTLFFSDIVNNNFYFVSYRLKTSEKKLNKNKIKQISNNE